MGEPEVFMLGKPQETKKFKQYVAAICGEYN